MKNLFTKIFLLLCLYCFSNCVTNKVAKQEEKILKMHAKGALISDVSNTIIQFDTIKGLMILPVKYKGEMKNFIFDTGAFSSLIRQNNDSKNIISVGGASNREVNMSFETIPSLKIGDFDFQETLALFNELEGLDKNVDGIIGQTIIRNTNWLINYPKKELILTKNDISDDSFKTIKIIREDTAPYTNVTIDGVDYKCVLDLGSSSYLSIPEGSKLAEKVLSKYKFTDYTRDTWTIGGLNKDYEKTSILPVMKIGDIEFNNVKMNVKKTSQLRIGLPFFSNYQIFIDNKNGVYKIKME
jgi:hypothetical protein